MRFGFETSGRDFSGVCATVRALVSQRLLIAFAPAQPLYSGLTRNRVRYRSLPARPAGRMFSCCAVDNIERLSPFPRQQSNMIEKINRAWPEPWIAVP
jgi:hypothetical protein